MRFTLLAGWVDLAFSQPVMNLGDSIVRMGPFSDTI